VEKVFVAQRVANKLYATEAAIDAAVVEAAQLLTDLVQARKDLGLSATVGNSATNKLAQAMAALNEARSATVEMHNELNGLKLRLGVRTKMIGFEKDPGPTPTGLHEVADLRDAV